jgi:hypothetical protein
MNVLNPPLVNALLRIGLMRPYFDIHINGDLYMRRWWVRGDEARRDAGQITAGVHNIVRPDADRDMHTHPCTFLTVRLWRWYRERLPKSQKQCATLDGTEFVERIRLPLTFSLRRAGDRHAITEVAPGGCWTFVIWFRKQGGWGFWRQDTGEFVPWRLYVGRRGT